MGFFANWFPGFGAVTVGSLVVSGATTFNGAVAVDGGDLTMGTGRAVVLAASSDTTDCPLQFAGDPNTGIVRPAADRINLVVGTAQRVQVGGAVADVLMTGTNQLAVLQFTEGADPGTPPADTVWVYAIVDGGSKTDLVADFQSGASQIFAQEP